MKNEATWIGLALFVFISFSFTVNAQQNEPVEQQNGVNKWYFSFQYVGFTYHPKGRQIPEIYPLKIDKDGHWVFELGASMSIDYKLEYVF
jgi:hypothetical protein